MPSMAEDFYAKLSAAPKSSTVSLKFVIFGLGDPKFRSSYLGAPKDMKKALEDAGAKCLMPMGEGSDRDPQGFRTGLAVFMPKALEQLKSQQEEAQKAAGAEEEQEVEEIEAPAPRKHHHKKKAPEVVVAFASTSGKSRGVAEHVANQIGSATGLAVPVKVLNDITMGELSHLSVLICIVSSAGLGDVPENGRKFLNDLTKQSSSSMASLSVAVFGIGDPSFKQWYLGGANAIMQAFESVGCKFLVPMGQGNDKDKEGAYTALNVWLPHLLTSIGIDESKVELRPAPETPVLYATGT